MNPSRKAVRLVAACAAALLCSVAVVRAETIEEKTRGMEAHDGFLPMYWDTDDGKLWLEVPRLNEELLYIVSLPAGIGSNDIGLDRNQLGLSRIVRFERVGPKLLMVQPNYRFRAESDNAAERRAVEEAFARSVLWGFEVAAETDGRVLVDASAFALRDAHGVAPRLLLAEQGAFSLDDARSALYLPRTKAFPENTEIEVTLTFTGKEPGAWVQHVVPTPEAITVRERHSFVKLPGPGFQPRFSDPRAGYITLAYDDYAMPLDAGLQKRLILRHRLEKKDPTAAVSEAVEPIVYYLDPGTPEPVRSALLDGARWWSQAFELAGYKDAFRVEMLPEGADPMDVRYNTISWVHRATRGWSYGASVDDPRTGEIIKGHVLLGSLRVRQDYLIAEGLLSPYTTGDELPLEPAAMALARLRQLSAHEVGHTLGLVHNYIASAQGRASVMDYPHPFARLAGDGSMDLSDAYASGIGGWDQVAIAYGYQDFPDDVDEASALTVILDEGRGRGLTFLTDQDARPPGSAHPEVHLWDNGEDATLELQRMMAVRRVGLERFGEHTIRRNTPLATMEEALVPLYLMHRFQIEAVAKVIAGERYEYALRGDGLEPRSSVPAQQQMNALEALLETLEPEGLAIPRTVLERLPPRPHTYPAHRELFPRHTGLVFDALAPAAVAADLSVSMLLAPERASRLVQQHALDPSLPSLAAVLERLVGEVFDVRPKDAYLAALARVVESVVVDRLFELAAVAPMTQVRALAAAQLDALESRLSSAASSSVSEDAAHYRMIVRQIAAFLERPLASQTPAPRLTPPPGGPIGMALTSWLDAGACAHE